MQEARQSPSAGDEVSVPVEYEQPLTERMRTFLRLELLYQQAVFHSEGGSEWNSRAAVGSIIEILAILTRGDVRSEVCKELERQSDMLRRFKSQPGVDLKRLESLLDNVAGLRTDLDTAGPNLTQPLKDDEFLSTIKHRSAIPGGTCVFDLPDYHFWLTRPHDVRSRALESWMRVLRPLCDAVAEVLWLTRESCLMKEQTAPGGMYQRALDRDESKALLRVILPSDAPYYPEISGGQHRFTIRFLEWPGYGERPHQTDGDVIFRLGLCG